MTFIYLYTVMLALKGIIVNGERQITECGVRPLRRHPRINSKYRIPKIIDGSPTKDGQFPWQVSLELLHPSLGFLGHWCGAVLVDPMWIISAAHCIHNDLFNLPLPPLWTVVLGEHNRMIESGYEQRVSVEKIVFHEKYENFQHDLVMIKLSEPADLSEESNIRTICLPFRAFGYPQSMDEELYDQKDDDTVAIPIRDNNFLRNIRIKHLQSNSNHSTGRRQSRRSHTRRNDKFLHGNLYTDDAVSGKATLQDLPYTDCIATGWGRSSTTSGDLADTLLQTKVPIHTNVKCKNAYGSNVKIHKGHLCAGKLNGKGGTCVGDSGGPLQCRLSKNGPWLLAGITSFGSGCAEQGYPDVYTRISYYIKWISDTISQTSDGS
ncbi:trypsin-1 [Bradysia coprophila]|uniref:trypsin-1 n=1 Tax=Bradysia coprophila TaxID=38358 RepID=UPI00187DD7D2|nr:trypsin-1 [Bradysia coprophila]